jgi:hypothetical protein
VRLVIPLILAALRARIAAPLLRAQREAHSRELAKYGERLTELAAEVRVAQDHARDLDAIIINCHEALDAASVPPAPVVQRIDVLASRVPAPAKPAPAVPEARRMAILGIVGERPWAPWAYQIAVRAGDPCWGALHPLSASSVERLVSDVAREGWLVADGKKPRRYTLTEKGRAALADSARVAS